MLVLPLCHTITTEYAMDFQFWLVKIIRLSKECSNFVPSPQEALYVKFNYPLYCTPYIEGYVS